MLLSHHKPNLRVVWKKQNAASGEIFNQRSALKGNAYINQTQKLKEIEEAQDRTSFNHIDSQCLELGKVHVE